MSVNLHSLYIAFGHVYYSKLFVYISYSTNSVDVMSPPSILLYCVFIYLGFYVAFNTVQVISRRVVGRAEETST